MTVVIPTGARVIDIDLDTAETNVFKNVPYETHEQFYSTDIGMAFLKFTGLEQDYTGCTARLTLINFNDGSKVQRIFEMDTTTTFVYPMLETELVHAGRWIGQLAVIKGGTTISDNPFRFKINGPIMSTALISFDNINTFTDQLTTIYDGLNTFLDVVISDESGRSDAEGLRVVAEGLRVTAEQMRVIADALRETKEGLRQSTFATNEGTRQVTFEGSEGTRQTTFEANEITRTGIVNSLVTAETIAQKVAEKYQLIEAESANRLLSVEQQLEQAVIVADTASLKADAMASGSPKGVYATLALLQAAYPTGTTGAYLVTADGKWYYWSGSAWVIGGVYQATGIAESSIDYSKLDFLSTTRVNLLDKTKLVDGYLNSSGAVVVGTSSHVTDFMPVEYGKTYISKLKGTWNSALYDTNKVFIRTFQMGDTLTISDSNAAFVRATIYPKKTFDFELMFVEGVVYPNEYIPYQVKIDILDNDFKRLLMSQSYKEEYVNLVDMTGYTVAAKGIHATTGLEVGAVAKASWFLPVEFGKLYVGNFLNYQLGACYDENKNYLCSIVDGIGTFGVDTRPFFIKRSDVKYIRVSFQNTLATPFVGEGMVMPSVITSKETRVKFTSDYFRNSLKKDLDVNRPLSSLKWNALGDSITHAPGKTRSYHSILAGQENIFVRNYGLTGTTIGYDETRPNDAMSIRYTTMDNDADIITVMGGINDMNNPSNFPLGAMADRTNTTFYGALHVLLIGLHKKYIGKRIGYITPLNYGNAAHEPYHKAIHDVCEYYSIPVLDLYKDGLINTRLAETNTAYFADGLHPNEDGHDVMARKIKQFLLTL